MPAELAEPAALFEFAAPAVPAEPAGLVKLAAPTVPAVPVVSLLSSEVACQDKDVVSLAGCCGGAAELTAWPGLCTRAGSKGTPQPEPCHTSSV